MAEELTQRSKPLVSIVANIPIMRLLMREALENAGFAIKKAEDGATAFSMFHVFHTDIHQAILLIPVLDDVKDASGKKARLMSAAYSSLFFLSLTFSYLINPPPTPSSLRELASQAIPEMNQKTDRVLL